MYVSGQKLSGDHNELIISGSMPIISAHFKDYILYPGFNH